MTRKTVAAIAALIVVLALVLFVGGRADGTNSVEPCVPQDAVEATYTDWSDWTVIESGLLSEPTAPDNSDVAEYRVTGPVQVGNGDGVEASDTRVWWVLKGKDWAPNTGVPPVDHPSWKPQPNLPNENSQHAYPGENGLGVPYQPGADNGNGDWFRFTGVYTAGKDETFHDEWSIEKRTRTFVPGKDAVVCDDETPPTDTPTTPVTPETPTETPVTPEVPSETPTPNEPESEQPEDETPVSTPQPPKDVQVIQCVNGVWVTSVNGEVISESGSCIQTNKNIVPQTFSETGL